MAFPNLELCFGGVGAAVRQSCSDPSPGYFYVNTLDHVKKLKDDALVG